MIWSDRDKLADMPGSGWSAIPGWTCPQLLRLYDELAPSLGGRIFVETGVAYGRSLAYMLEREWPQTPPIVYAVDIWEDYMGGDQWDISWCRALGSPQEACEIMLRRWGSHVDRIHFVRKTGAEAASMFADASVQAMFLDDQHTYQSVRDGISAWLPKMVSGGVLCGHDINAHYPGVELAVVEAFGADGFEKRLNEDGWGGIWKWVKP